MICIVILMFKVVDYLMNKFADYKQTVVFVKRITIL